MPKVGRVKTPGTPSPYGKAFERKQKLTVFTLAIDFDKPPLMLGPLRDKCETVVGFELPCLALPPSGVKILIMNEGVSCCGL